MAGRPAKPQIIKELTGTARADRKNSNAPQYPKIKKIPLVPTLLKKGKRSKEAAALWAT